MAVGRIGFQTAGWGFKPQIRISNHRIGFQSGSDAAREGEQWGEETPNGWQDRVSIGRIGFQINRGIGVHTAG